MSIRRFFGIFWRRSGSCIAMIPNDPLAYIAIHSCYILSSILFARGAYRPALQVCRSTRPCNTCGIQNLHPRPFSPQTSIQPCTIRSLAPQHTSHTSGMPQSNLGTITLSVVTCPNIQRPAQSWFAPPSSRVAFTFTSKFKPQPRTFPLIINTQEPRILFEPAFPIR